MLVDNQLPIVVAAKERLRISYKLLMQALVAVVDFFKQSIPYTLPSTFRRALEKLPLMILAWIFALACPCWRSYASMLVAPNRRDLPVVLRC